MERKKKTHFAVQMKHSVTDCTLCVDDAKQSLLFYNKNSNQNYKPPSGEKQICSVVLFINLPRMVEVFVLFYSGLGFVDTNLSLQSHFHALLFPCSSTASCLKQQFSCFFCTWILQNWSCKQRRLFLYLTLKQWCFFIHVLLLWKEVNGRGQCVEQISTTQPHL